MAISSEGLPPAPNFVERKLVLLLADLAGYTRAAERAEAVELATFLDRYYHRCDEVIRRHGGRIVKFMGDGCLAVFDGEQGAEAVECALDLERAELAQADRWGLRLGANIHVATVAEGEIGPGRRYDVVGAGVNHTFLMGSGPGIRISEPVYRQLPSDRRAPWHERKAPAVYTM
jgi:class 3 adenylate cyclase